MSALFSRSDKTFKKLSKELFPDISQNLKIVKDEEFLEYNETHKTVLFAVYLRTDKDNLVLTIDTGKFAKISNVPQTMLDSGLYPNFLFDTGLICGKNFLDTAFEVSSTQALHRLAKNTTCFPIGVVETSKSYVVVFNIIMFNSLLTDSEITLKKGFHFIPIETLKCADTLQEEIAESLVLVKPKEETIDE